MLVFFQVSHFSFGSYRNWVAEEVDASRAILSSQLGWSDATQIKVVATLFWESSFINASRNSDAFQVVDVLLYDCIKTNSTGFWLSRRRGRKRERRGALELPRRQQVTAPVSLSFVFFSFAMQDCGIMRVTLMCFIWLDGWWGGSTWRRHQVGSELYLLSLSLSLPPLPTSLCIYIYL